MIISHEEEQVTKIEVVEDVVCNVCGESVGRSWDGKRLRDHIHINKEFGYLSTREGEVHNIDICENCYEKIIDTFKIKPYVESVETQDWH